MSQVDLVKTSEGLSFGEMDTSDGKLLVGAEEFSIPPEQLIHTEQDVLDIVDPLLTPIKERLNEVENNIGNDEGGSSTITEEEIIEIVTPLLTPINERIDKIGGFKLTEVKGLFKFTSASNSTYKTFSFNECGDITKDFVVMIMHSQATWTCVYSYYGQYLLTHNYYNSVSIMCDAGGIFDLNYRLIKGETGITGIEYRSNMVNGYMAIYQF